MGISISQQLATFGASVVLGVILGVIYEVFRTVRSLIKGRTVSVFIQDILFWIICSFVVYSFYLVFTEGTVRYFVLVGAYIGFIVYMKTLGKIIAFLFRKIFYPIHFAAAWVKKTLICLINRIFSRKKTKIISENTCNADN